VEEIKKVFYIYLDFSKLNSSEKRLYMNQIMHILEKIKNPQEMWEIVPSDKNEIVCINPDILTKEEAISFEGIKELISKKLGNIF